VADADTHFDPQQGVFNPLFAEVATEVVVVPDGQPLSKLLPAAGSSVVHNIFTDLKRHDLGPTFHELNYDGTFQREFLTTPLWGVGSTAPYGHDGRSINLLEVILRHRGEAQQVRDTFAVLPQVQQRRILEALGSLILFPPDDTASNLEPGDPSVPNFPQRGRIDLAVGVERLVGRLGHRVRGSEPETSHHVCNGEEECEALHVLSTASNQCGLWSTSVMP
jgi:hypothetical protein